MRPRSFALGLTAGAAARALVPQLLLIKFRRDVERLNAGDSTSLLGVYADDFVLHFHEGPHRWSGDWIGRDGMRRFLDHFMAAGVQGEIRQIAISGPPWR